MSPFLRPDLANLSIPDDVREALATCPVGTKIHFEEERLGYTVQARDDRFLICTKPFNPRRTVLYTIVDLEELIRGPENLVFGMGAETREQCEDMLKRLRGRLYGEPKTEVSMRHRIALKVRKVGMGAETREQCEDMLKRLRGRLYGEPKTEVSMRHRIALKVRKVTPPEKRR